MRRIGAWMMALLLCVVGTGCGRQLGSPISYEDFTGTYPVEGYVPSQEDLGRAPYSYAGAGPHFSVVLNVRQNGPCSYRESGPQQRPWLRAGRISRSAVRSTTPWL